MPARTVAERSADLQLARWQEEARSNATPFPILPQAHKPHSYTSAFAPFISVTQPGAGIHLSDYAAFIETIAEASRWRIPDDVARPYPTASPVCEAAPSFVPTPHRIVPRLRWFHYFRRDREERIQQRRIALAFNDWVERHNTDAAWQWSEDKIKYEQAAKNAVGEWTRAKAAWNAANAHDVEKASQLLEGYTSGSAAGVADFFTAHLAVVPLPAWCPREVDIHFDEEQHLLLLVVRLPHFSSLPVFKERPLNLTSKVAPATRKEAAEVCERFAFLIPLRLMSEVSEVDRKQRLGVIACNAYVVCDDPATGRQRRNTILSVVAKSEDLKALRLDRVEPQSCFRGLGGIAAAQVLDLVAVQPLVRFNKDDSRIVSSSPVASMGPYRRLIS